MSAGAHADAALVADGGDLPGAGAGRPPARAPASGASFAGAIDAARRGVTAGDGGTRAARPAPAAAALPAAATIHDLASHSASAVDDAAIVGLLDTPAIAARLGAGRFDNIEIVTSAPTRRQILCLLLQAEMPPLDATDKTGWKAWHSATVDCADGVRAALSAAALHGDIKREHDAWSETLILKHYVVTLQSTSRAPTPASAAGPAAVTVVGGGRSSTREDTLHKLAGRPAGLSSRECESAFQCSLRHFATTDPMFTGRQPGVNLLLRSNLVDKLSYFDFSTTVKAFTARVGAVLPAVDLVGRLWVGAVRHLHAKHGGTPTLTAAEWAVFWEEARSFTAALATFRTPGADKPLPQEKIRRTLMARLEPGALRSAVHGGSADALLNWWGTGMPPLV